MFGVRLSSSRSKRKFALVCLLTMAVASPVTLFGIGKKKKAAYAPQPSILEKLDYSKIVWPRPPDIARLKYTTYYSGEKIDYGTDKKKKEKWMDRVAGTTLETDQVKMRFALNEPYGMAVDSKGNLYVADVKVGGIFIFNTETKDLEIIKNGSQAHFSRIIGLAIDETDRLFVADNELHHVLIFNAKHEVEASVTEGLVRPGGVAVDIKNRILYVSDSELDQVLAYDADTLKLLRKMGTTGQKHSLTTPGDFAEPGGMAVDQKGNLYVADTLNNRIEVFDPDGGFLSTFGKNGDGPSDFARPKGVAIDGDGHIWVSDGVQNRIKAFDKKWRLLLFIGGMGNLPGQFSALCGITIDKQNRVFTSEMYPGRVQQFLYIDDAKATDEKARRQAVLDKKAGIKTVTPVAAPVVKPADATPVKPADAGAVKDSAPAKGQDSAVK